MHRRRRFGHRQGGGRSDRVGKGFTEDPALFEAVLPVVTEALDRAAVDGITDPHQLQQVVRRTIGRWVNDTYRRRPMIVPERRRGVEPSEPIGRAARRSDMLRKLAIVGAALALGGCASAAAPAGNSPLRPSASASGTATSSNRAVAVRDEQHIIASFRPPAGAKRLPGRPAGAGSLNQTTFTGMPSDTVHGTQWWVVAGGRRPYSPGWRCRRARRRTAPARATGGGRRTSPGLRSPVCSTTACSRPPRWRWTAVRSSVSTPR